MSIERKVFHENINNCSAVRRLQEMQPLAGQGTLVAPSTSKGLKGRKEETSYCVGQRRIGDKVVTCVIIDTWQSQANRFESQLARLVMDKKVKIPHIAVMNRSGKPALTINGEQLTTFTASHRIADIHIRETLLDGEPLFKTQKGSKWANCTDNDCTALFEVCPYALIGGVWGSVRGAGGIGLKMPRSLVSEIVAIDAQVNQGVNGARIDPCIQSSPDVRFDEVTGMLTNLESGTQLRLSERGGGMIPPTRTELGGVSCLRLEQNTTISLSRFGCLRFPINGEYSDERDRAARSVLSALAILGAVANEDCCHLRSGCDIDYVGEVKWEFVKRSMVTHSFTVKLAEAIQLYEECVEYAKECGLPWSDAIYVTETEEIAQVKERSRQQAAERGFSEDSSKDSGEPVDSEE